MNGRLHLVRGGRDDEPTAAEEAAARQFDALAGAHYDSQAERSMSVLMESHDSPVERWLRRAILVLVGMLLGLVLGALQGCGGGDTPDPAAPDCVDAAAPAPGTKAAAQWRQRCGREL